MEPKAPAPQTLAPKTPKAGRLRPLIAIGILVVVGSLVGVLAGKRVAPSLTGEDLKAAPIACDKAWVAKTWAAANRAAAMRGQELQGLDLIVLVSPYGWSNLSLGEQKNLGLAAACQLGASFVSATVHFRYDANGSDAMKLSNVDLYRMAVARFVPEPTGPAPDGFRELKWGAAPTTALNPLSGDSVWVTGVKPPPAFLGVTPSDEDYLFEHRRLFGGDVFLTGGGGLRADQGRRPEGLRRPLNGRDRRPEGQLHLGLARQEGADPAQLRQGQVQRYPTLRAG